MKHFTTSFPSLCCLAIITLQTAHAQPTPPTFPMPAVESGPDYHHASTVAQGYLDGKARLIRAIGTARYNASLAARNEEIAYEYSLRNSRLAVETYFERKLANREYRKQLRRAPVTQERAIRISAARRPKPLPDWAINYSTGELSWPSPINGESYRMSRDRVLHVLRGDTSYTDRRQAIDAMQNVMKRELHAGNIFPQEYAIAKKFLLSLRYEFATPLSHPVGGGEMAAASKDSTRVAVQ